VRDGRTASLSIGIALVFSAMRSFFEVSVPGPSASYRVEIAAVRWISEDRS